MGLKNKVEDIGEVDVDPWGKLRVKALSAKWISDTAKTYGTGNLTNDKALDYYVELVASSVVDDSGQPELKTEEEKQEFADNSFRSIQKLANRSFSTFSI